jgi:hypothetical protein
MFSHNDQVNHKENKYSIQLETDNYDLYKLCLQMCRMCTDINREIRHDLSGINSKIPQDYIFEVGM